MVPGFCVSMSIIGVHGIMAGTSTVDFGGAKNAGSAVGIVDAGDPSHRDVVMLATVVLGQFDGAVISLDMVDNSKLSAPRGLNAFPRPTDVALGLTIFSNSVIVNELKILFDR